MGTNMENGVYGSLSQCFSAMCDFRQFIYFKLYIFKYFQIQRENKIWKILKELD